MHQPLISIIITILNGEKTLEGCLSSIYRQIFSDYELVIVDGGSEDRTLDIINESKIANKVVQVIPKAGLYAGLNAGINLSTGKWLYFIGADDELHSPDTLVKVAKIISSKEKDTRVIVGNVECVKQKNLIRPRFGSPHLLSYLVHHQGMFYERSIFTNSFYNEQMNIASDYEYNLNLALTNVPHQQMDITVCNFGGDGISENQFKKGYAEMQQVHRRLFKGATRYWVMSYFWLRRNTGIFLRRYKLMAIRAKLKEFFG